MLFAILQKGDGAGRNPDFSLSAVKSLLLILVRASFHYWIFRDLHYESMKYSIIMFSYFDKCYMDREIFVISGDSL